MKGEEAVAFAVGFFRGEGGGEKRAAVHEGLGAVEASGQPGERGRGVEAGAAVGVVEAEAGGALGGYFLAFPPWAGVGLTSSSSERTSS